MKPQVSILDTYTYLYELLVNAVICDMLIPFDELNYVGGRKSGKTTTLVLIWVILAIHCPKKFGWVFVRNRVNDSVNFFKDICEILDAFGIEYQASSVKMEITVNGNTARVLGVENDRNTKGAKKAGFPRFHNVKYIFIMFEERFEFPESNVRSVIEAVRSIDANPDNKPQYIVLNACNPWAKSSEYIKYVSSIQSFNVNVLKSTGSQFGYYEYDLGNGMNKKVIVHYTNWRVAKQFISESEVAQILDTWNIDKRRAATTDWGMPGYEENAIYTHVLSSIGEAVYQDHISLCAGGDYGWGRDESSGKTAFYFGGATLNNGIDIYGEYVSDNHTYVKDPHKVAKEIVDFYVCCMRDYLAANNKHYPPELHCRVDNSANGFISILNKEVQDRRIQWLRFGACKKYRVQDRIEITIGLMARQMLRLNSFGNYPVKLLKQEFELSYYEKTETQKRAKENDHGINGFEYAIENVMYQFNRIVGDDRAGRRKVW